MSATALEQFLGIIGLVAGTAIIIATIARAVGG